MYQSKIVVDGQLERKSSVQQKVEQDIAFLKHRILMMKQQRVQNTIVIGTYEDMLRSRESVLSWLLDGNLPS